MLRPATPDDRPALVALVLAEDAAWASAAPVSEDEAAEVIEDHGLGGAVFERDGRIAGYAAAGDETLMLVDPADDPAPALEELVAWLREQGCDEVDTYAADVRRVAWLEEHGYTHRRSFFDLQRDGDPPLAPADWPAGVVVAPFRPGEDDEAVHALVYVDAAWTDVPGHSDKTLEAWRSMITPEYRGWVASRDGRLAGWVVGRVFSDGRGWIQQLAVGRSERGRGLGRALLLHALADQRENGATCFALGVQAANDTAIGLYRGVGFEVTREWRVYGR